MTRPRPDARAGRPRARAGAVLGVTLALLTACGGGPGDAAADLTGEGLVLAAGGTPADPAVEGSLPRPNFHDFGSVPWGEVVEHTFELRNTDPVSVALLRATPSCNCTIPKLEAVAPDGTVVRADSSNPEALLRVPAGGLLRVRLRVDTEAVLQPNRDKLVSIRMVTDSPSSTFITLEVHLIATRELTVFPTVADLGNVPASTGGSIDLTIATAGEARLVPTEILATPDGYVVSMGNDPRSDVHWIVSATLEPGREEGFSGGTIVVGTAHLDGSPGPPIEIPVRALVVADLQVSPPAVSLRPRDGGLYHEVRIISHLPGHRFLVERVEVEPAELTDVVAEALPRGADGRGASSSWDLRVTVADPRPDVAYEGRLIVHLDDAQYPRLELPLVAHSRP